MHGIVSRRLELINESIRRYQTELYSLTAETNGESQAEAMLPGFNEMIFITGESYIEINGMSRLVRHNHYFVINQRIWLVEVDAYGGHRISVSSNNNPLVRAILSEKNRHNLTRREVVLKSTGKPIIIHKLDVSVDITSDNFTISAQVNTAPSGKRADYRLFITNVEISTDEDFEKCGGVIANEILSLRHEDYED